MKKKTFINKDFFVFIICCFLSIILFFSKDMNGIKNAKTHLSNFFSIIFSPKNSAIKLTNLESINDSLINELKYIKQENIKLNQKINNIDLYQNYNKKLDKLISDYEYLPAKVLSHSFNKSANILNLNIGLNDGLSEGYKAVVDFEGNLVGKTSFIGDKITEVHKISDKLFHVLVKTENNVSGQFSYVSRNLGIIESVTKYYKNFLKEGDIFYTSSSSSIYPENIKVAKIVSVESKPTKIHLDITVEILTKLDALENVFIIK